MTICLPKGSLPATVCSYDVEVQRYFAGNLTTSYQNRRLWVQPIRVS